MTNLKKNQEFDKIPGSERSRRSKDEVVGPADENKVIEFQLYLKDKFKEEKHRIFEKMANLLPRDREYVSPEEFASKYGADEEDIDRVKSFAKEYGLKV
jgi:kumamolisin